MKINKKQNNLKIIKNKKEIKKVKGTLFKSIPFTFYKTINTKFERSDENKNNKRKQILDMVKFNKRFKTPKCIYNASELELLEIEGIGENTARSILKSKNEKQIENNIIYLQENNIKLITIEDEEYPKNLKQIYDYPISIYVKGNIELLNKKCISIVGCREPSIYGEKAAKYFSYNLAKNNICIVSGLAKGIDSFAHIGALIENKERKSNEKQKNDEKEKNINNKKTTKSYAKTIAVLGNGLDTIYPKENKELANMIINQGGTIISEYPLGTTPERINFPARNRIVSGLSTGTLVIEAKEKSGTLITVDFALEQGKEVFVVPGNINSINSVGTNRLIKEGAKLVTCYEEIIEEGCY